MTNLELIEKAEEVRDTINYFLKQAKNPECIYSEQEAMHELKTLFMQTLTEEDKDIFSEMDHITQLNLIDYEVSKYL